MERIAGKMLTTALRDPQSGDCLMRLSQWVDPDTVEIDDEDTGTGPTIKVIAYKGRMKLRGTIDRDAYRLWLTKDWPMPVPVVPPATDSTERSPVLSAFLGSSKPKPVNATAPKARATGPLVRRA